MSELSEMIAETAAKVFAEASPADGFDAALWKKIEEAGLDRVLLPEDQGGAGEDFEAAVAVARAAGAAAASVPICETLVANWAVAMGGQNPKPGPKAILLQPERQIKWPPQSDLVWTGGAITIPWQPAATVLFIDGDIARSRVATSRAFGGDEHTSVAGEPLISIAQEIEGLRPDWASPVVSFAVPPLALYATLMAAALSGAMQTANAMTFEYANTRKQFGRTLGAFQAIQHMAARMAEEAAATEAAVQVAARELSGTNPLWHAAVAKGRASEAAGKVAASAHQIHGAIGFTREHALHRYTRRLWAWRDRAGSEQYWYEQIGRAAQEAGRDGLWPGITAGLKL